MIQAITVFRIVFGDEGEVGGSLAEPAQHYLSVALRGWQVD